MLELLGRDRPALARDARDEAQDLVLTEDRFERRGALASAVGVAYGVVGEDPRERGEVAVDHRRVERIGELRARAVAGLEPRPLLTDVLSLARSEHAASLRPSVSAIAA